MTSTATTTAQDAPYFPGDLVNHQKLGRARLVAELDGGAWTAEWLTGKYAGQTRTITPDAKRTKMLEPAPRPKPEPVPAPKPKKAPATPKVEAPAWPADKPAIRPSEPPAADGARRRNPVDFPRVAREVQALDGGWAEILEAADKPTTAAHVGNKIRNNRLAGFETGSWQAKVVGERVWVRYLGA